MEFPAQILDGESFAPTNDWLLNPATAEYKSIMLSPDARDSGGSHTPTTTLRSGLVLGKITASDLWIDYDDDGTDDGRRAALGILLKPCKLFDPFGNAAVSPIASVAVIKGRIRKGNTFGRDSGSDTDLAALGFILEESFE